MVVSTYIGEHGSMNKSELADAVADAAGLSKADGARALDAVIDTITAALKSGDSVSLVGLELSR